jgi:transcriptional regulator with XRE-family HTH domain
MQYPIHTTAELGEAVLAVRKAHGLRQDDAASAAGVGHVFLRDVERGKPTAQIGRILRVLDELGIKIYLDIPEEVFQNLDVVHKIPNAASTRSIAPMTPVVNKNVHQKLIPIPKFKKG